jgi:hypothetical protein
MTLTEILDGLAELGRMRLERLERERQRMIEIALPEYRAKLRQNLDQYFNESELRDLAFDMNVDYESLGGKGKSDKARELVAYCERRGTIPDLVDKCCEFRRNVTWEGEYE